MEGIRELREQYGSAATFAIAYGAGNKVAPKLINDKKRIAKKKFKKLRSLFQQANWVMGIDRGEAFTLKGVYKKGCRKGVSYVKLFRVKDEAIYYTVTKHRHNPL